mmetsp:Transcript_20737/g.41776  ORF Transcript_20737/g.41776 Transcript_20737/m.41776 type:complete len:353 (-) Transcript_20737:207-1265(-)
METADRTVAYSTEDFKTGATFVWTPTAAGTYHVVCSVGSGSHCAFGQNFKVMVEAAAPTMTTANGVTTYSVVPREDSLHYWGMNPHDDIVAKVGDTIHFKTAQGFHDIGLVPTSAEYSSCDMTNFDMWVNTAGAIQADKPGTVTVANGMYEYEFTLTEDHIGTWYFVCSVALGGHCRAGQKMLLTVTAGTPAAEPLKVMGSHVPFWTVGLMYDDMTITLGDSVSFTSDMEGYHDVAVLVDAECPEAECCAAGAMETADRTVAYSTEDFKTGATFVWTPTAAGTYHVVCSVGSGSHCAFGQNFKVMVEAAAEDDDVIGATTPSPGDEESSASSTVPAALLAVMAAVASLVYSQ